MCIYPWLRANFARRIRLRLRLVYFIRIFFGGARFRARQTDEWIALCLDPVTCCETVVMHRDFYALENGATTIRLFGFLKPGKSRRAQCNGKQRRLGMLLRSVLLVYTFTSTLGFRYYFCSKGPQDGNSCQVCGRLSGNAPRKTQ